MKQLFKNGMQNIEQLDGRVEEMAALLEVRRSALSDEEVKI